jgi:hypothetical protein
LKVLAREGLLVMEPRRGCCVAAIGVEGVARLFDVLELLEIQLVREAEMGGNRHAGEAIGRLREKLLLALGPSYGQAENTLFERITPALAAAFVRQDQDEAERVWRDYAIARRRLAGCRTQRHAAGQPSPTDRRLIDSGPMC